jgi:hypothetical protein
MGGGLPVTRLCLLHTVHQGPAYHQGIRRGGGELQANGPAHSEFISGINGKEGLPLCASSAL